MIVNGTLIKEALTDELLPSAAARPSAPRKRVCFLQFGTDAASTKFVGMKMKMAATLHIEARHIVSTVATTVEALAVMDECIAEQYDGIVVQLPLPEGIDTTVLINALPVSMDIDVLGTAALMAFASGGSERVPPVARAVDLILKLYNVSLEHKNIVVRGKGALVGGPIMMLFGRMNVPYTAIDIHTPEPEQRAALKNADIIVSGIGVPYSLTPDMIKDGVVLIDAGTSEHPSNSSGHGHKLAGDIDPACAAKASLYTPVPGGVGPITVACLFTNLFV